MMRLEFDLVKLAQFPKSTKIPSPMNRMNLSGCFIGAVGLAA
jgi:hypothetical protein